MHLTIRQTARGAAVRSGLGESELITAAEARDFAELVAEAAWRVTGGGGAVLEARPCQTCVIVRCTGLASGDELERFAAALLSAADLAGRWEDPETAKRSAKAKASYARRKRQPQLEAV